MVARGNCSGPDARSKREQHSNAVVNKRHRTSKPDAPDAAKGRPTVETALTGILERDRESAADPDLRARCVGRAALKLGVDSQSMGGGSDRISDPLSAGFD